MVYIKKINDKSTFKLVCWFRLCGTMKISKHNNYSPLIPYFELEYWIVNNENGDNFNFPTKDGN